jgi:hypothetical protein
MLRKYRLAAASVLCFGMVTYLAAAMPAGYTGTIFDSLKGVPQQIPGLIETPYFDKGADGVTFHYSGGNAGDCFWRNGDPGKAVSLQFFGDYKDFVSNATVKNVDSMCYPPNKHAHLGWIQNGEWLNYTVHVNKAGSYKMIFHESDVDANNLIVVTFSGMDPDSIINMPVSLRPPGDHEAYHDWKWDTTAKKLQLDTGLYVVKLAFFQGAWNFHAMKFILDGTPVKEMPEAGLAPKGFAISPVVKGNSLTLSYSLPQAGLTSISVFDCAGRMEISGAATMVSAGNHSATIGLNGLGKGVHFVRVKQNGTAVTRSFTVAR